MMTCPDAGTWRAWLDHASGDPMADLSAHLEACASCQATMGDLRQNALLAASALASLSPASVPSAAQVTLARKRLQWLRRAGALVQAPVEQPIQPAREKPAMILSQTFRRWRVALSGLAAALVLAFLVVTPQGQAAAAAFLAQFRSERLVVLPMNPTQLEASADSLSQLEHLGSLQMPETKPQQVASMADASRLAGFSLKQPVATSLPANLGETPASIHVSQAALVRFTFDRAKALAYFQSIGHPDVKVPEKFQGASLVVNVPSVVAFMYGGGGSGANTSSGGALILVQAGVLTAGAEGNVTLDEMRDFLLGLPGLPLETARQLRAIQDWRSAVPIPIPADQVRWQQTTLAGQPGLLLADSTGAGGAALWRSDDRIYGVLGTATADELRRVADGLR